MPQAPLEKGGDQKHLIKGHIHVTKQRERPNKRIVNNINKL
jgi:hypothetical protein